MMTLVMISSSAKDVQRELSEENSVLLDVRTPAEFRALHAEGAVNLPLDQISPEAVQQLIGEEKKIFIICQGGNRSVAACGKLSGKRFNNLINVEGGTNAWKADGLPVVQGKQTISIERQTRIAAGLLVVAGVLLGAFVHPLWLILPGFVGAGLAFAGITDTCGMGMMLARMPWNQ